MSNPTDGEQAAESGAQAIPQQAGQPSPVRLARSAYTAHIAACPKCQDDARDRCSPGQELWRAWEGACEDAYRQLADWAP